jgi:hypothetical protein
MTAQGDEGPVAVLIRTSALLIGADMTRQLVVIFHIRKKHEQEAASRLVLRSKHMIHRDRGRCARRPPPNHCGLESSDCV